MSNASSPRAKRGSCDSVGSKRSRSASLDKQARQEPRAPMLIMPRPAAPTNAVAGPSSTRSDHRRHVLDAVRTSACVGRAPCHHLDGMQGTRSMPSSTHSQHMCHMVARSFPSPL